MIYKTPTPADEETILADLCNRAKCSAWAREQLRQYLELRYMPSYTPPAANIAEATARMVYALREGLSELTALDEYGAGQDA